MKDRLIICHRNSLSDGTIFKNNIEKFIYRLYQTLSRCFPFDFNGFKLAYMYQKCYTSKQKKNYQILS